MKPLTLEETSLKEEMKARTLIFGEYTDPKAKDKFNVLCHLEDFEIECWELEKENKKLKKVISKAINKLKQLDKQVQNGLCKENYMGGARTKNLINELKDILKEVSE